MSGHWIQTFSGHAFTPLSPRVEDIAIVDIAHALSMLCRYNGHCRQFYSVAEHSVAVSRWLQAQGASLVTQQWGLLHDAAEAYLGDVPRPLKAVMPEYRAAEDALLQVIAQRFKLNWPIPDVVKEADTRILHDEAHCFMEPPSKPWGIPGDPLGVALHGHNPVIAREVFMFTFDRLYDERDV